MSWFEEDSYYYDEDLFVSTLSDTRVKASERTCGACPEVHEGELVDGRMFHFRFRHGVACLYVAPLGQYPCDSYPAVPDSVAYDKPYPDDDLAGIFGCQEDRDATFTRCLNQIYGDET